MEIITNFIQQSFAYIVPFVILLGLLIFVHELGHFLVAKYYGVRVEVFSLGFGRKILSFRRGDTEYCLSLIPFGGYVKMFGDDPTAEIAEEQKKYSFNHKPVGQRIAVVLAGPLMNLFFAGFLFGLLAIVGESQIKAVVGDVPEKSAAAEAGFKTGDEVLSVNGESIKIWDELKEVIENSGDKKVQVEVKRFNSEDTATLAFTPKTVANKNILSLAPTVGEIEGLTYLSRSATIGVADPTSNAGIAGFKTGDTIKTVNGVTTTRWIDLVNYMNTNKDLTAYEFEVIRDPTKEEKPLTFTVSNVDLKSAVNGVQALSQLGLEPADLFIAKVLENSAAYHAGLREGDKFLSIGGERISEWTELVRIVKGYDPSEDKELNVIVLRDGVERSYSLVPQKMKQLAPTGKEEESYALGVTTSMGIAPPAVAVVKTANPLKVITRGVQQTYHWTVTTVVSFVRLIQNKVSAKSIGGPLMIGQLAGETFKVGISPFLKIMAIISINLFVLNLLPVPVLDGGHLLFFSIEALRGAPLSMRKMEIAQTVGLVLLMSLMVFALFNDVTRLLGFHW